MSGGYDYSIDLPRWDTQKKEDTLELNDQVGLEKVATVDAKLGRPKSSDSNNTVAEEEIIQSGKNYLMELESESLKLLGKFEKDVDKVTFKNFGKDLFDREIQDFSIAYKEAREKIISEWRNFKDKCKDRFKDIKNRFEQQDQIVNAFRQANNISEEARSASFSDWIIILIITLFAVTIEIQINKFVLGSVSAGGDDYGFLISLMVAIINVWVSSLWGYTIAKHMNDIDRSKRSFYIAITTLYGFFIFYLNWMYAAYREITEESTNLFGARKITLDEITAMLAEATTPWSETLSLPSITLWVLGMSFGYFALYKFYKFDDPIPGYGRLSRRRNLFKKELDGMNDELNKKRVELKEEYNSIQTKMYENSKKNLNKFKKDCDDNCIKYNEIINACQRLKTKFINRRLKCIDGILHMLREYRKINKRIQSAKDKNWSPPAYWDNEINFDKTKNDGVYLFDDSMSLLKSDTEKDDLIHHERDAINKRYDQKRDELIEKLEEFKNNTVNLE